jgi:hypothetical protein
MWERNFCRGLGHLITMPRRKTSISQSSSVLAGGSAGTSSQHMSFADAVCRILDTLRLQWPVNVLFCCTGQAKSLFMWQAPTHLCIIKWTLPWQSLKFLFCCMFWALVHS